MKTFKSFIAEEKPNIKRKAKGEQDFVDAHEVEVTDKTDQANNSAKVTTKAGSGKHKNDRQDNKQEFGEEIELEESTGKEISAKMMKSKMMKTFAPKVAKMTKVTRADLEKMLPDYVPGSEITKLFQEEVEEIDEISGELAKRVYNTRRMHSDNWKITPTQKRRLKMGIDDGHPFRNVVIAQRSAKKRLAKDLAKEEVELEEETKTYMVKFEKNGKVSLKNYEAKSDLDARSKAKVDAKRMGMEVSSVRLKEEVELDEKMVNPGLERLAAAKKRQQPSHTNPGLEALAKKKKSLRELRKSVNEADFSKKETKMAHTIGKEFEKKGVGDEAQGGPYAVASAMVRDKPEAAKKAYKTIQSKMKEEADAELLFNLYNDLNEENQEMFMSQLEEDADALLEFAQRFLAD